MIDEHQVREMLHRRANAVPTFVVDAPKVARRARRRLLANGAIAMLAAAAIAVATLAGVDAIRSAPVPADRPTSSPAPGVLRADGEVLSFTGAPDVPGDLVAVNPETGEERVLVEDLEVVYSAEWSADGRWVAYETATPIGSPLPWPTPPEGGRDLWVVGPHKPRRVATGIGAYGSALRWHWMWSPTGAELATISLSRLSTIDPATGETTIVGDVTSAPAWSPDGTRMAFGARGGALYSVDVRSGERSLLVRLPGETNLDSVDQILWSPDGAHIAVMNDLAPGAGRLYVVNADGSNVRVLVDDFGPAGFAFESAGIAWSPDGTRLAYADWSEPDQKVQISVAPMDGSASAEIVSLVASCHSASAGGAGPAVRSKCGLTWSPDGSRIAFKTEIGVPIPGEGLAKTVAIGADGQGKAERIDELTYRSWAGGSYP